MVTGRFSVSPRARKKTSKAGAASYDILKTEAWSAFS